MIERTTLTYYAGAVAAALAALNAFLLAYPGDLVPQVFLIVIGAATAFMSALAAFLAKGPPASTDDVVADL